MNSIMWTVFKLIVMLLVMVKMRKCEIVKHKIVFKSVGNRFPKVLTIIGLLAGMNLAKNFHVVAGKMDVMGQQYNTLSFEFEAETEQTSNGIQTTIEGSSDGSLQLQGLPLTYPPQFFKRSFEKNKRFRRSLQKNDDNSFKLNEAIAEVSSTVPAPVSLSDPLEIEKLSETESKINHTYLPSTTITIQSEQPIENEGYNYNQPVIPPITYGPPESDNAKPDGSYFYPKPEVNTPPTTYGSPIASLTLPFEQRPPQFQPSIPIGGQFFTMSDFNVQNNQPFHFMKPFCLSYEIYPVSHFKPSLPDYYRNFLDYNRPPKPEVSYAPLNWFRSRFLKKN